MKAVVYGGADDGETFAGLLESFGPLCFRKIECSLCCGYDEYIKALKESCFDMALILIDGAAGMEGVIAAKTLCPETPVAWFSNDKDFGSESYRLGCAYFAQKPITQEAVAHALERCGV